MALKNNEKHKPKVNSISEVEKKNKQQIDK